MNWLCPIFVSTSSISFRTPPTFQIGRTYLKSAEQAIGFWRDFPDSSSQSKDTSQKIHPCDFPHGLILIMQTFRLTKNFLSGWNKIMKFKLISQTIRHKATCNSRTTVQHKSNVITDNPLTFTMPATMQRARDDASDQSPRSSMLTGEDANGFPEGWGGNTDGKIQYSQERNKKIRKRKEEWKKVLNEGKASKHSQRPLDRTSIDMAQRSSKFLMCDDDDDDTDFKVRSRKHLTTISNNDGPEEKDTKSSRDLKARRLRGEVVHAAKRSVKEVDNEDAVEALRKVREAKQLEEERKLKALEREAIAKRARLNKARVLELEMAAPPEAVVTVGKFVEADMASVLSELPSVAPRRRKKKGKKKVSMERPEESPWWDKILVEILSASCCSGREIGLEPPQ